MKLGEMFGHWAQVRADLLATMDKFSEEELSFVPYPGAWPVGKVLVHIADCEDYWLHYVVRRTLEMEPVYEFADYPSQAAIKTLLANARTRTIGLLAQLGESDLNTPVQTPRGEQFTAGWVIWHVLEHEIHHRGELSQTLGLLGREGLDV